MGNSRRDETYETTERTRDRTRKKTRTRRHEDSEGIRSLRLQELIREEVNFLLRGEIRDPRLADVEITMVELAVDGSCARLWFGVERREDRTDGQEGQEKKRQDEIAHSLDRAAGFMRNRLAEGLGLKRTPELRFRYDPAIRQPGRHEKEIHHGTYDD
jgi:ribosome-binding factor A